MNQIEKIKENEHAQNVLSVGPNPLGRSNKRKLDEIQILTILTMKNMTKTELSKHFKITLSKISEINKGYIYKEFQKYNNEKEYKEGRGAYLKMLSVK